jgi:NADH:ubiquinone oxidoreductase subunit C
VSRPAELWPGRVRTAYTSAFGDGVEVDEGFGPLTVDVPAAHWVEALLLARDGLGCSFFDFLTAVDELGSDDEGFRIVCHVADHRSPGRVVHLLVRTRVPREAAVLPSAVEVYAGARWHERETHEMFGIHFEGNHDLRNLYLPTDFEGHPLRKEFPLLARVVKPWPGIVDVEPMPGEDPEDEPTEAEEGT